MGKSDEKPARRPPGERDDGAMDRIPPELVGKIRKIHFRSARLVSTEMAGHYKSVFRGAGIEFEEVREYSPGDEVKSIDWKVSARLGRPYIKRFREERELVLMLLIDVSASAGFGTTGVSKREKAAETAAVLAFNAIRNNDKVGVIFFTDRVEKFIPPKKGAAHVWRLIREIFTFSPEHRGTDIREALGFLGRVQRKRVVAFLISDFLDEGFGAEIKTLVRRHEMVGVALSDPGDFALPEAGIVRVRDPETGAWRDLDASHAPTRQRYQDMTRQRYQDRLNDLKRAGIDRVEVTTADSAADRLSLYFRMREKRRR